MFLDICIYYTLVSFLCQAFILNNYLLLQIFRANIELQYKL